MPSRDQDDITRAGQAAIARAKRRQSEEVTPDDLLAGLLQVASRFGVVRIGPWTIDLEALGEAPAETAHTGNGQRVVYAPASAALFDRAAAIARRDGAARVEVVHMLVAFDGEEDGLMGRLKQTHAITGPEWRASLAEWQPAAAIRPAERGIEAKPAAAELLSPDEAAEVLGVHTQTVRGYIRSGKLPAHRLAGERAIRILRRDLFALLEPVTPEDGVDSEA